MLHNSFAPYMRHAYPWKSCGRCSAGCGGELRESAARSTTPSAAFR